MPRQLNIGVAQEETYNDIVYKLSIKQGTEEQRMPTTINDVGEIVDASDIGTYSGTFTRGELAYTRDTQRVFVGNYDGGVNNNIQQTVGGTLAGNKYLGFIDTKPDYNISGNNTKPKDLAAELMSLSWRSHNNIDDKAPIKTADNKWSKVSYYNKDYDAYDGDYMYDIYRNALILFDHNIKQNDPEQEVYQLENSRRKSILTPYNPTKIENNKIPTQGTPARDVYNHTNDMYGDGYVCFYNIVPDGKTIGFVEKKISTEDGEETYNNYTQNVIEIKSIPDSLMGKLSIPETISVKEVRSLIESDPLILPNYITLSKFNNYNISVEPPNIKGDVDSYILSFECDRKNRVLTGRFENNSSSSTIYTLNLGNGLLAGDGSSVITFSPNKPNNTLQLAISSVSGSGDLNSNPFNIEGFNGYNFYSSNFVISNNGAIIGENTYDENYASLVKEYTNRFINENSKFNYLKCPSPIIHNFAPRSGSYEFKFNIDPVVYSAKVLDEDTEGYVVGIKKDIATDISAEDLRTPYFFCENGEVHEDPENPGKYCYPEDSGILVEPNGGVLVNNSIFIKAEYKFSSTDPIWNFLIIDDNGFKIYLKETFDNLTDERKNAEIEKIEINDTSYENVTSFFTTSLGVIDGANAENAINFLEYGTDGIKHEYLSDDNDATPLTEEETKKTDFTDIPEPEKIEDSNLIIYTYVDNNNNITWKITKEVIPVIDETTGETTEETTEERELSRTVTKSITYDNLIYKHVVTLESTYDEDAQVFEKIEDYQVKNKRYTITKIYKNISSAFDGERLEFINNEEKYYMCSLPTVNYCTILKYDTINNYYYCNELDKVDLVKVYYTDSAQGDRPNWYSKEIDLTNGESTSDIFIDENYIKPNSNEMIYKIDLMKGDNIGYTFNLITDKDYTIMGSGDDDTSGDGGDDEEESNSSNNFTFAFTLPDNEGDEVVLPTVSRYVEYGEDKIENFYYKVNEIDLNNLDYVLLEHSITATDENKKEISAIEALKKIFLVIPSHATSVLLKCVAGSGTLKINKKLNDYNLASFYPTVTWKKEGATNNNPIIMGICGANDIRAVITEDTENADLISLTAGKTGYVELPLDINSSGKKYFDFNFEGTGSIYIVAYKV